MVTNNIVIPIIISAIPILTKFTVIRGGIEPLKNLILTP